MEFLLYICGIIIDFILTPNLMRKSILLLIALVFNLTIVAQETNLEKANSLLKVQKELTFSFQVNNNKDVGLFSNDLSIVNYDAQTNTVTAWANSDQFNEFLSKGIPFEVLDSENDLTERLMSNQVSTRLNDPSYTLTFPLTSYPTYADYVQQMTDFENLYPNLCEVVNIGATTEGDKDLLFLKISDNISTNEQEPRLMYTSSMHGDEITGYPMMLDLIDYFLTAYNDTGHSDYTRIKNLIDNSEIWINPNANPDGTYYNNSSNTSVANARRGNANDIDLNRNYPDPSGVAHPDGEAYQTETLAFMSLAESTHFVIAANFHGGVEVVNYPWDYTSARHPDDLWWIHVSREYADNAQADGPAGYMDYQNNGITHGADWYLVNGGRQDYMNFENQCKESTIEISDTKKPAAALLDDFWNYNQEALIDYLIQGTYGFRGVVKDASTNAPIEATIKVVGHDDLGSWTTSELTFGDYYRPIKAGTYNLIFEAPCYQSFTLTGETISDYETKVLTDVLLTPLNTPPTGLSAASIATTSATINWDATGTSYDLRYRVVGAPTWTEVTGLTNNTYDLSGLSADTQYEIQVLGYCNANSSAYSTSVNFTTLAVNYCASASTNSSYEWISRVQLNTIDNTSNTSNYSDFTSLTTVLTQNAEYTITITPEWSSTKYDEGYSVWIDYNKDGDFEDSGEQVWTQSPTQNNTVSGTFTIPSNIEFGTTRMRIIMKDGDISGPCIEYTYGEVEDYSVYLAYDGLMYAGNTWSPSAPTSSTGTSNALVLDGSYTITSDVVVNDIEINSNGSVTVSKTGSITVNGDITGNDNIVLESDSNEYSSLIVSGSVTGDVEYQRHINTNAGGNDLVAPPVSGQIFSDFIPVNPNIMSNGTNTLYLFGPFDKPSGSYVLYADTESSALTAGMGYRAASTDGDTFTFAGTVNTGNINVSIPNSGAQYLEWNLIGNPYPSYIGLSGFLSGNISQFDSQKTGVYGYDGSASNGWTIWNQAYSDANPSSVITPGQGFFVASKPGGGTVTFTPSMRTTGTSDDFIIGRNSTTTTISHLKVKLEDSGQIYNTDFYFTDNATLRLDPGYDAGIFGNSAPEFAIYSHLVEENTGIDMAIQSVGNTDLSNNIIIPVGINAYQGQQLTVSIAETTLDSNVDVYFEDNVTNAVSLLNTNNYTFTASTDLLGTGRFFLRFESGTLSTIDNEITGLQIFNTTNPKTLHVKGLLTESTQLNVFDILGRKILAQELEAKVNSQKIDISDLGIGIYVVEIKNDNQIRTKKIIVN